MQLDYLWYDKLTEEVELLKYNEDWNTTIVKVNRINVQEAWIKYWWSFLSTLGHALSHADMFNCKKIMDVFNNYVIDYIKEWLLVLDN